MKKFLIFIASVALFVGCAKSPEPKKHEMQGCGMGCGMQMQKCGEGCGMNDKKMPMQGCPMHQNMQHKH